MRQVWPVQGQRGLSIFVHLGNNDRLLSEGGFQHRCDVFFGGWSGYKPELWVAPLDVINKQTDSEHEGRRKEYDREVVPGRSVQLSSKGGNTK